MKKVMLSAVGCLFLFNFHAQEETTKSEPADTTRVNLGKIELIIVDREPDTEDSEVEWNDSTDIEEPKEHRDNEPHWAGLDFGFNALMLSDFSTPGAPYDYLRNDVSRSQVWNLNFMEHKFKIVKEYVGITTGLGLNWTQVGFRNNYILTTANDSTFAVMDSTNSYDKNKLRGLYLTAPLLLEFNTNKDNDEGFYFAAGVVGGYKLGSKYKLYQIENKEETLYENRESYNLNPFKLDATVRLGYKSFGAFASYGLVSLFEKGATQDVYPLNMGITLNF